jgi:hypothetical protein
MMGLGTRDAVRDGVSRHARPRPLRGPPAIPDHRPAAAIVAAADRPAGAMAPPSFPAPTAPARRSFPSTRTA